MTPNFTPSPLSAAVIAACELAPDASARISADLATLDRLSAIEAGLQRIKTDEAAAGESLGAAQRQHADAIVNAATGGDADAPTTQRKLRAAVVDAVTHSEGLAMARETLESERIARESTVQTEVETQLGGVPPRHGQQLWQAAAADIEAALVPLRTVAAHVEALVSITGCRDATEWLAELKVPGLGFRSTPLLCRANLQATPEGIAEVKAASDALRAAGAALPFDALAAMRAYVPVARRGPPPPAKSTGWSSTNARTVAARAVERSAP